MSGDEIILTVASTALGLVGWATWLYGLARVSRFRYGSRLVSAIAVWLAVAALVIGVVLLTASASDVRTSSEYLAMYFGLGLAWTRVGAAGLAWTGLNPRHDVGERGNRAAIAPVGGAIVGIACCYSGGNIGDGPGWWVVIFCAALATGSLFVLWLLLASITRIVDIITIDRDPASGIRAGAFLIAAGIVLGRAVAGDWISVNDTLWDFVARAWAVVPLLAVAAFVERLAAPTPETPHPSVVAFGVLPALAYIGAAVAYVLQPVAQ